MKQAIAWLLILSATAFAADDQLLQQALKDGALARVEKIDVVRFDNYSTRTQVKLNTKASKTTTVNGQPLSANVVVSTISGNAGTATALAANGLNCNAGQAALGVDAAGAVEGCFAVEPFLILLAVDASGGDQTVELTGASTMIVKNDDSANFVRIIPGTGRTLMGLTEYMLSVQYEAVVFRLNSTTYIKQ